ncbi:Low temperature viability protein-domain-containing protein [Mycotypha africana]|uniref:Low temperature viability protein-domain-containing protein n=1 Tax=Mycotypha africana TaxID=64632 RepID=UPI00230040DE|nr:Low temperature viability protein-domain-containing protein [Mycotypha africana]KAI8973511.1 Low temperature viability protein-domain-containing protein [Mycotypha africana]
MGKKPFIDKKNAKHFHVVHRSQKDPLINDSEAPDRVLQEVLPANQLKHKTQEEIDRVKTKPKKLTQDEIDARIGQAAQYGIFYDDSEYDYMQHLRVIGESTDAVFLEAPKKEKPKKMENDSFLKEDKDEYREKKNPQLFELPSEVLPSAVEMSVGVMNQSTGMDGGLQPDMDPRLREVLEALDDEEYVEDDVDDFFDELNAEGDPYVPEEEEDEYFDDEVEYYSDYSDRQQQQYEEGEGEGEEEINQENYDWETAFRKFKLSQSQNKATGSDNDDDNFDRHTKQTGFSVSSSAMHRNRQLRLLDDRFEKIEEEYNEDDDFDEDDEYLDEEVEQREDFDAILDEFLEKYEILGKKMEPKLEGDSPALQLERIRQELPKPDVKEVEDAEEKKFNKQQESVALTRAALEGLNGSTKSKLKKTEDYIGLERPVQKQRAAWDVQTVISTYSNLENHPALISDRGLSRKIRLDPKTGMPILVEVDRRKKTNSKMNETSIPEEDEDNETSEEEDEEDYEPAENKGVPRSKHESKEEKKARKQAAKEAKKVKS